MKAEYVWSASSSGFYPMVEKERLVASGGWPDDGVDISGVEYSSLFPAPPGKYIDTVDGRPGWVDMPPPTHEEELAKAAEEKKIRIGAANSHMNGRQWPGKAALNRLTVEEVSKYNAWLDYLDALEAVDTSTSPSVDWPMPPS